jgi:hypothetical protein
MRRILLAFAGLSLLLALSMPSTALGLGLSSVSLRQVAASTPGGGAGGASSDIFQVCDNGKAKDSTVCRDRQASSNPLTGKDGLIIKIARIVGVIAGAAAVIIIIISGLRYVLSNGDTKQATDSRNALLYALVGLVIIVIAESIISFVINRV